MLGRTYSELALQKEPFDRNQYTPSFDPIEDAVLGVSPNAGNAFAATLDTNIHAIAVYPTQTLLLAGGKAVRTIEQKAPPTLDALVSSVHDTEWVSQTGGLVRLNAAVILQGTTMTIDCAADQRGRHDRQEGRLPGGEQPRDAQHQRRLRARQRRQHAQRVPVADQSPQGRPFVLAVADSTMNIDHSTFRYLGRDWNTSYGVSWSKGATGSITNSTLDHNFIGVYTNASPSLKVLDNTLNYNSLYGVDPHSGSSHMDIENNVADYNGRHGIIFSDHVTASTVRNNTTEHNGLNGIMMDELSTGNVIDQQHVGVQPLRRHRARRLVEQHADGRTRSATTASASPTRGSSVDTDRRQQRDLPQSAGGARPLAQSQPGRVERRRVALGSHRADLEDRGRAC